MTDKTASDMPACPVCGYELEMDDCEWSDDGAYGYDGNFCPNCGCKISKDERMDVELKPCPFCGGEAEKRYHDVYMLDYVKCRKCGAQTALCANEAEADAAWNTRAERTCHMEREPWSDCLWRCSSCESYHVHPSDYAYEYCPHCGARVVDE